MEVYFSKRAVFTDEGLAPSGSWFSDAVRMVPLLAWFLPPLRRKRVEFPSYILGYRLEPTPRELRLIHTNKLFGHAVVTVHQGDRPLTFADLLGPELVPEVSPDVEELLRVEGALREANVIWTRFFESMPDPTAD